MTDYERGVCDGMQQCIDYVSDSRCNWMGEWRVAAYRIFSALKSMRYSKMGTPQAVPGDMPANWPNPTREAQLQ